GSGSYRYALVPGALPSGLSLTSAGVLSVTTTVAGTYHFTVQATDTSLAGVTGTQVCTLTVAAAAPASVVLTAPTRAPAGTVVSAPATATAGVGFSVTVRPSDAFGNTIDYSGPVGLASSDGQVVHLSPAPFTLTHGSGTATVALDVAHSVTLTAYLGGYRGTS